MTAAGHASSIGDWLSECASRAGAANLNVDGVPITVTELDAAAHRGAAGLRGIGLESGDHVGVIMRASVPALTAWFAIARAGMVEVPLNPDSGTAILEHCLRQARVRALVCDAEFATTLVPLARRIESIRHVLVEGEGAPIPVEPGADATAFDDLLRCTPGDPPKVDPASPAVILYTSGTTGPPKGVLLSHQANVNLARHTVKLMQYSARDRLFSVFPLYHSNARYCSVMAAIEAGAGLVMHRRFSASRFWQICRDNDITAFNYQGAMMSLLFKQAPRPDDGDHPVRAAFGAPCPAAIFDAFEDRFGVELTEIYGSTEVSIVCDMPPDRRRVGTAGTESVNYHVSVVDDDDEHLPAGTAGEIVVRPKRPGMMFDGYHGRPDATAESWRNLWFHTGDRGEIDDDGFVTFLDRAKDTIRRRGENISSWEVERAIGEDDTVVQVAAYGVPSELSEDEVMVAVVPAAGADLDPAALVARCDGRLTAFARPRYVRVMATLPQTPSQRVEKFRLRAEGVTDDTWDRERA
ncbi:AMP-binding protein [Gordonia zhaorongruii]|uniref:AMP-binding protein n=1 Tax=Gordonia zhaorongruii TaxID=2597659 RepID=UPI00104B989F|nr:AMP-binding protein [Gordonia zhaorongruii]